MATYWLWINGGLWINGEYRGTVNAPPMHDAVSAVSSRTQIGDDVRLTDTRGEDPNDIPDIDEDTP